MARYNKLPRLLWSTGSLAEMDMPKCCPATLYLYLMTCDRPSVVPGVLLVGVGGIVDATGWDYDDVSECLRRLSEESYVVASKRPPAVFLPEALAADPPKKGNVETGWLAALDEMPECPPVDAAKAMMANGCEWVRRVSEESRKTLGNQKQEQKQEQKQNKNVAATAAPAVAAPRRASSGSRGPTKFGLASPAYHLATTLRDSIREHTPDSRDGATDAQLQSWSKDIDLMLRRDDREADEVEEVIRHTHRHSDFWRPNIRSGKKLRQHYERLRDDMRKKKPAAPRGSYNGRTQQYDWTTQRNPTQAEFDAMTDEEIFGESLS